MITLFRGAGATGRVFAIAGGRRHDRGLGWSGFIGPLTAVAVLPTTPQIVNFAIQAYARDQQILTVNGSLQVSLTPEALNTFDFTVDRNTGGYVANWTSGLKTIVTEHLLGPIRAKAREFDVVTAVTSQNEFEAAVQAAATSGASPLPSQGIQVVSCSVNLIEPDDDEIAEAIGAAERQRMLIEADAALHARRLKAATNDRAVKQYEGETERTLELERSELVRMQGANNIAQAEADAAATRIRLEPLAALQPQQVLAAGLMEAARSGRLGSIALTTELLTAIGKDGG
jgi:hypothetical protein